MFEKRESWFWAWERRVMRWGVRRVLISRAALGGVCEGEVERWAGLDVMDTFASSRARNRMYSWRNIRSWVRYRDNTGMVIRPSEQQRRKVLWVALYSLRGAARDTRWAVSEAGA